MYISTAQPTSVNMQQLLRIEAGRLRCFYTNMSRVCTVYTFIVAWFFVPTQPHHSSYLYSFVFAASSRSSFLRIFPDCSRQLLSSILRFG
jgi:hypothetical protein